MLNQLRLKVRLLPLAVGAALLLQGGSAAALNLVQAYEAALKNDPAYRSAYFANESGKENRVLGRAALLPTVTGSYSASRNNLRDEVNNRSTEQSYISRSAVLQVRQPLVSVDAYARYKLGNAQSEYAAAQFDSQGQEVILRVTGAYLDVLLRQDQLALAKAERDMYAEQRKVNDLLLSKGEGTRTDALETQSRLDLAEAQVLEAQDNLTNAKDTLAGVIGGEVGELDALRPGFRPAPAEVQSYDVWKQTALDNNPDLKTLRYGVEIARQEITRARAGHTPRLDFVGTLQKSDSDTTNTINRRQNLSSVGIQLNVPLYAGGSVNAQSRQAVANRSKAEEDLQVQTDKVLIELRKDYNILVSSVARIDALIKAVDSASLLITATEQSIKGGVRINLDLLVAQRQLHTAQRDLAQARYNYMISSLRLRSAAGTLSGDDVRLLAAHFQ